MDGLKTPLYKKHIDLKGNMVSFGGYLLPTHYTSINHEHLVVRSKAGLFDVSHMGEFIVSGPDAELFLQKITINDVSNLSVGQAQYTAMCYEDGGIVDDFIIYKFEGKYMLVVNSNNIKKDMEWLKKNKSGDIEISDISREMGLLALQGPKSKDILQLLTDEDLDSLKFYTFLTGKIDGLEATISRTGYTGELGYELYIDSNHIADIWDKLLEVGKNYGINPVGLGCRDTLRLEMKYLLYGNDIDEKTNPLEAGLGWITKIDKDHFIGKSTICNSQKRNTKHLICFEMEEKSIPRKGYKIYSGEDLIGEITSGTMSPSLGKGIGLGYVSTPFKNIGSELDIEIRGRKKKATVVKAPFYKKGSLLA